MRNLKLLVVSLLFLLSSMSVMAEDYIYTGAWSYHFDQKDHPITNQKHDLIGYQHDAWMIGSYHNSFGDQSYMIGREFQVRQYGNFNLTVVAGADYGYKSCTGPTTNKDAVWCPAIMPVLTYTKYDIQPSLAIMGRALTLQIRWRFN